MLLAKSRWLFPLYGDEPPHWVLGWVDLSARKMHIFDSCPELQSYMWVEPVSRFLSLKRMLILSQFLQALVEVAETVFTTLGKPEIDLEPWDVMRHSPSLLQRQMNGFACGFFVIHGMRVVGNGESVACVTNDQTAKVKSETLDLIKDSLPYVYLCLES
jgi:Ulp1 family protease